MGGVKIHRLWVLAIILLLPGAQVWKGSAASVCEGISQSCTPKWTIQRVPTTIMPFVFFHQRKSGGTSWRHIIYQRARELARSRLESDEGLKNAITAVLPRNDTLAFIPCLTHSCKLWTIPNPFIPGDEKGRNFTIYAGHLHWSVIHHSFPTFRRHLNLLQGLTNFREPVSRVVSCLRYRFRQDFESPDSFKKYSAKELGELLINRLSGLGFGCNNEPLRLLSGYSDENEINQLGLPQHALLATTLVRQAKLHLLSSVVVAVLEQQKETMTVVNHYFPWLRLPNELPHKNLSPNSISDNIMGNVNDGEWLSHEQRLVILELNRPEVEVYNFANYILGQQYKLLMSKSEGKRD